MCSYSLIVKKEAAYQHPHFLCVCLFSAGLSRWSAVQSVKRLFFRWSQSWRDSNNRVYKTLILLCWSWFLSLSSLSCPSHLPPPPILTPFLNSLLSNWHTAANYMLHVKFIYIVYFFIFYLSIFWSISTLFCVYWCYDSLACHSFLSNP